MAASFGNRRLQWQLLFSVIAASSVTALSMLLILEAVGTAERLVVADVHHTLNGALDQLLLQYRNRVGADPNWNTLPWQAQDVSLRSLSRVVLSSYPDVEGGFYSNAAGGWEAVVPDAIRRAINVRIATSQERASLVVQENHDLLVLEARRIEPTELVLWTSKRLSGRNDPSDRRRFVLLAVLALSGLVSVGVVIATGVRLRQGIHEIQRGLLSLERDFCHLLPERDDELGEISGSINRMAAVRRRLEAEVAREQRLRSMGKLAAGVAHEIRNPLNSIRLAMEMAVSRLARNALRREDLQMVCSEVDRLSHLLTELLTFEQAKQPPGERQAIWPVVRHCVDVLTPQACERGIQLSLVNRAGPVEAVFDPQGLKQAILNLVLNAMQASQPGDTVRVLVAQGVHGARVEVHDEGPGLTAEQQEHLFEAFYTTKPAGTGLGLAVSRELIAGMGGDLVYEHRAPGATFLISLPGRISS
jgi:signal transduction histidine kinase